MSDSSSDTSDDALVGFDETNGLAGDLEGESDGTAAGEDRSDAERQGDGYDDGTGGTLAGDDPRDALDDPAAVTPADTDEAFHTGD